MKVYDEEISANGKRRLLLATNIDELSLLYAILLKAERYYPHCPETSVSRSRLVSMLRGIRKCLEQKNVIKNNKWIKNNKTVGAPK